MLRGDWYLDEPDLAEERRRCWRMLDRFNATRADDDDERRLILEALLAKFGPGASVLPRFQCSYDAQISIGTNSFVNNDAVFMDDALITIGDDVCPDRPTRATAHSPASDGRPRTTSCWVGAPLYRAITRR
jgi:maltose O-acetyltransferase